MLGTTQQQPNMVPRSATIKRCSRQYRVVANANSWVISHGPQQRFEKSVKLNSPYFFDTLMNDMLEHMGENGLKCQMNGLAYTTSLLVLEDRS